MKRLFRRIFAFALAQLLFGSVSAPALAASSGVVFTDGDIVALGPGSVYTGTDTFASFKDVMPGDVLNAELTVSNQSKNCDYIMVYLLPVPHDAQGNPLSPQVLAEIQSDSRKGTTDEIDYMLDFLNQLQLSVSAGGTEIYSGSPVMIGARAGSVYLGTVNKGASLDIALRLTVPATLTNQYSTRIGELDWLFTVQAFTDTVHTARMVWADGNAADRPKSATVTLLRDGVSYATATLSDANAWTYTWNKLDSSHSWSVVESAVPAGYSVSYNTDTANTTVITNTKNGYTPTPGSPVELTVYKRWNDKSTSNRPSSVNITLYNGYTAAETVTLSDTNNWQYHWSGLDGSGSWSVQEVNIPAGYVPVYTGSSGTVTVTNTASLIQTGQLSWPVPVMAGLGLLLVIWGIIVFKKKRKDENA